MVSTGVKIIGVAVIIVGVAVIVAVIRGNNTNDVDDSKLVYHYKQTLQGLFTDRENAKGLAIIVGMVDEHSQYSVRGAGMDVKNMEETFKKLGFVVLKKQDVNHTELQSVVKAASEYPYITESPSCKVVAFYFVGHGNSESQKALMVLKGGDKYFVEDVVSLFHPVNTKQMKHLKRLFFFDMCLGLERDQGVRRDNVTVPLLEYAVPAKGNSLVAFATTIGYYVRGDDNGGFWTRFLHKNLLKDQDIFSVLADTWEETVHYTTGSPHINRHVQGPSMTACMGHLNLRRLGTKQELHDTTERIPNSSTSTAGMTNIPSLLDKESIPLPGVYDQKASGITRDQGCNPGNYRSCQDITRCVSMAPTSGYYQLQSANGLRVVYCDMEGTHCGGEGGWMRVAHLNMNDPSSQCPVGFRVETIDDKRFCIRDTSNAGCGSMLFEPFGLTYSRVCGYVRGYSFATVDAFYNAGARSSNEPLSGNYVDGVSITYGTPPTHIWTYAAGLQEINADIEKNCCPCNTSPNSVPIPAYVGNDYYCESGILHYLPKWHTNDPLWDGMQCGEDEEPCCDRTGLPWFNKNTPTPTTATINVRVCLDQPGHDENIGIEHLEIYIK